MTDLRLDGNDWPFPKSTPQAVSMEQAPEAWESDRVLYRHFESVAQYVEQRPSKPNEKHDLTYSGDAQRWLGCDSYAEAERICKSGVWAAGAKRMDDELGSMDVPKPRSIKRKGIWADQGDMLDIHKVYGGQLDQAWRRTTRNPRPASQSLVISFPLMISSYHTADKLFWCGAAALKLADLLTEAGYNVSLIGTHGTEYRGYTSYDSLMLKHPSDPLDVQALILTMGFAGFARTAGFRVIAANPFEVSDGLGRALYDTDKPLENLRLPSSSILRGLFNRVNGRDSAIQWITQQLALLDKTHLEAA